MASGPAKRKTAQGSITSTDHPHIDALIKSAGHIMIGAIEPARNATVAYDGKQAVAMRAMSPMSQFNLDALGCGHYYGQGQWPAVNEWNKPGASWT